MARMMPNYPTEARPPYIHPAPPSGTQPAPRYPGRPRTGNRVKQKGFEFCQASTTPERSNQLHFGAAHTRMPSCWSCWVILEQGAKVCPLCGGDLTRPVRLVDPNLQPLVAQTHLVQKWKIV